MPDKRYMRYECHDLQSGAGQPFPHILQQVLIVNGLPQVPCNDVDV